MLSPYTVLDLTDDRGELAAMILGDLGADVIKVEPPQGSSSRRMAPFLPDGPEPERSLHYFAFNRNKRGITLDLAGDAGRGVLLRLAERADFVIESARPGEMSSLGCGFEELRRVNPRIVYVAITPFGQDGPYAEFPAGDLTVAALAGPDERTGRSGPGAHQGLSAPGVAPHRGRGGGGRADGPRQDALHRRGPVRGRFGPDRHGVDDAQRCNGQGHPRV